MWIENRENVDKIDPRPFIHISAWPYLENVNKLYILQYLHF